MFEVLSPCKINLFLYITGKNDQGMHNLQTLFALLNYGDTMQFYPDKDIVIEGNFNCRLEDNLIYKAIKILESHCNKKINIKIKVDKKIPQGGGLGGGSSNAATTLLVLNKIFNLNLDNKTLQMLGKRLGADVPVFVLSQSAFAQGVGDILEPINLNEQFYVVKTPMVHVSTKEVFAQKDLVRDTPVRDLDTLLKLPFDNDFTKTVSFKYKEVGQLLNQLVKYGQPHLSGSGGSCFLSFSTYQRAFEVFNMLKQEDPNGQIFLAQSINYSPVLKALDSINDCSIFKL